MKLRSRGLGRKELEMDFREYDVTREGDEVLISGTIKKPVHWDFSIRMSPEDIPGMIKVGLSPATIGMFFRWLNPFRKRNVVEDEAPKTMAGAKAAADAKAKAEAEGAAADEEPKAGRAARKQAAAEAKAAAKNAKAAEAAKPAKAAKPESDGDADSESAAASDDDAPSDDNEGTAA